MKRWKDKTVTEKCMSWVIENVTGTIAFAWSMLAWIATGAVVCDDLREAGATTRWGALCLMWRWHRTIVAMEMGKWSTIDEILADAARENNNV